MSRLFFWLLLTLIAVLAFIPSYQDLPSVISLSDILNHSAAFFTLTLFYKAAFPAQSVKRQFITLLAFGAFIEFVQFFLPTRSADIKDLAVDAFAITVALLYLRFYDRYLRMHLTKLARR